MAPNNFVRAEQVVAQALGVLERDTTLLQFVWKGLPTERFLGAKNDTVTLKLPAYTSARTRVMRSGTQIIVDSLDETSVDVKLDTHVYKAVGISDEELTLDISDFGEQVSAPVMGSVVRKVNDAIGAAMAGADPEVTVDLDVDNMYRGVLEARRALNLASVPATDRFLAVGANVELELLDSPQLRQVDMSGSSDALRDAVIGRIGGFIAIPCVDLDPDIAIAAHRSAFAVPLLAPAVPDGASWGERRTYRNMSLRVLRDYDPTGSDGPQDRFLADTFMGVGITKDRGTVDGDGKFQPSEDGDDDPILVRAVRLQLAGS